MFILFIIAGLIICFGIILLMIRIQYIRNGFLAEATVTDLYIVKSTSSESWDTLHLTFKYNTLNGEEITFKWDDFSPKSGWQIGHKATIVYQTYNPKHPAFLTYWGSFGLAT